MTAALAFGTACGSNDDSGDGDSSSGGSPTGDGDLSTTGGTSGDPGSGGSQLGDGDGDGDLPGDGEGDAPPMVDLSCRSEGDDITTIVFVNGCDDDVKYAGSDISGGTIPAGTSTCVDIGSATEVLSAKRYWGWIGEDPGGEKHTLAEFTFNTDFNDFDWYNISHVDAHNLTMQILALDRPDCDTLTCADSLIDGCPEVGLLMDEGGNVISCVSPDRDNPESPVALHFESCEDGYAWSGDDQQGDDTSPVRACAGEDWQIVFCP
jgi:hypothetical protein